MGHDKISETGRTVSGGNKFLICLEALVDMVIDGGGAHSHPGGMSILTDDWLTEQRSEGQNDEEEGVFNSSRELRLENEDYTLPLALCLLGMGIATMLLLIQFRQYFLQDDDDEEEAQANLSCCHQMSGSSLPIVCSRARTRIRESVVGGYYALQSKPEESPRHSLSSLIETGQSHDWDMSALQSPSENIGSTDYLETIAEESPALSEDTATEAESNSATIRSDSREWFELMPTLSYRFDPRDNTRPASRLPESKSMLYHDIEMPTVDPLSPSITNTFESIVDSALDRKTRHEPIRSTRIEINLLRKDPTLKSSPLNTFDRPAAKLETINTAPTLESLSSLPGSQVGVKCLPTSHDEDDKASSRSYRSWTASERKVMREAEEELRYLKREWSILLSSEASQSSLGSDVPFDNWENFALERLRGVREKIATLSATESHNIEQEQPSDWASDEQHSITESLMAEVDQMLTLPMIGDSWERHRKQEMIQLKQRISELKGDINF